VNVPQNSAVRRGIQPAVMQRLFRLVIALVFAFGLVFGGSGSKLARAQELPGDTPAPANGSLTASDVPPVPASYTTRSLGWLQLSYPSSAEERVAPLLSDADAVKAQLASALGQPVLQRVEVRVAPTVADMARLAPPSVPPPTYASGVAYPHLNLILLSMLAPRGAEAVDLDEVLRHELAHIALNDAVGGRHVPLWFNEGLAISLSGENRFDREKVLWNATLSGTLLPFAELDRGFPREHFEVGIAYAESADFVRFLMRRTDEARFSAMITRVKDGQPFERALSDAYGSDLRKLEFQWRGEAERRYSVIPILTGGGLIWVVVIGALGAAYVKKRRRAKKILDRWAHEEAMEDAMRARQAARAEDELLDLGVAALPSLKIEADGRWHTLH
jgi:Peptidase MA superfamily